jgi:cobalt-zinc-cadmium efflux system protein
LAKVKEEHQGKIKYMSPHNHSHTHFHSKTGSRKQNILFVGLLNVFFVVVEIIAGILTNSVAILSDALHDAGDSFALISAYFAEGQAEKKKDKKRTFGYARISLLSALLNAVILIGGSIYILTEAVSRFFTPEPVNGLGMMAVAVVGVGINTVAYFRLSKGISSNEKVLSWHLLEDVLGWIAVLVGGVIIYFTNLFIVDTLITIGYTTFILLGVSRNLKEVFNILLQGVPSHINQIEVEEKIKKVEGITNIHDIHIWSLDGEQSIFTAHITIKDEVKNLLEIKERVKDILHHCKIEHSTLEFEFEGECEEGYCKF